MEQIIIDVQANTSKAEKALEGLSDQFENLSEAGDENKEGLEALDDVTGGYVSRVKDLSSKFKGVALGAKNFIKTLRGVKGALLATGIGAVVVALGAIVYYWDEITTFLKGGEISLQEQADSIRESLGLLDDQIVLLNLQIQLLDEQGLSSKELVKEKRKLILLQQEENRLLLEKLQQQLKSETEQVRELSLLDKIKVKVVEITNAYGGAAIARAKAMAGTEEEQKRLKELEDQIQKAKERSLTLDLSLLKLDKEVVESRKKRVDDTLKLEQQKANDLEKIRKGEIDTQAERRAEEKRAIEQQYKELIDLAVLYEENTVELENARRTKLQELQDKFDKEDEDARQAALDKKTKDEQEAADERERIADLEFQAKQTSAMGYASALSEVAGVIGEETAAGKAMAAASSLINTYAAITGQLRAFSGYGIPGYAIAQAIATGAVGFANVKKILSTKVPGSSGGGASAVGGVGAIQPSFNIVGASPTNQLAEAIGEQDQQPIQAYVVTNDVTSAQSLENNIVQGATLGG